MDLFEKAHVVKNKISSRKSSKSVIDVKKKLKLMLYGYRRSDNELIKESENVQNDMEDSSSVSGYSDLNITNSSYEGDITGETDNFSQNNSILKDNALTSDSSQLNSTLDQINATNDSLHSFDSISDYNNDRKSLSEDISFERHVDNFTDEFCSSNSDFIETSTDIDSYDSEFENLENDTKIKKEIKTKKIKLEDDNTVNVRNVYNGPLRPQDDLDESDDFDSLSIEMSNISLPEVIEYKGPYRPKGEKSLDIPLVDNLGMNVSKDSDNTGDSMAPFVSIMASDMQSHSFSDILGEYKHPTIRNLPSDSQNVYATNNSLFETENMSLVDVETDEDANSLVPEIDNDQTVEDIELETIQLEDTITEPQEEESTAYDNTVQSEETIQRESTDSMESTMDVPVNVYYGRNCTCVLVLKHPTEIYIHGKIRIQVLGGSAEVMGFELKDKPCDVYAPYYNYAQYIRTIESQNANYGLFGKLTSSGLMVAEAEDIVTTIGDFDVVLSMKPLKSRQMDFVENNFTVTDLFNKQNKHNIVPSLRKASHVLGCSLYLTKPIKRFEENACWQQAIECGMKEHSRGIVCGGKGSGKSTFLQYYVNKMLARGPVLVVDLDPGQCEFNVAGNISATVVTEPLLGPNFTHLKTPEMMLYIGMISTMDSPKRYAAAVEALIIHCNSDERLRNMPWIINTMGMTNTIGLKFTTLIILHAQPTFLLQLDSKNPKKRYDFHLYSQTIKNLYFEDYQMDKMFANVKDANLDYSFFLVQHADNAVKKDHSLAPRDARYLNYLSYFGQLINATNGDFHGIVPYAVSLSDVSLGLNVKVSEDVVTKVINGKVVALCSSGFGAGNIFTLSQEPLRCFGAGLVRGVDWDQGVVYVVCSAGCTANTLVYADWAPELRVVSAGLPPGLTLPYRATSHYHQRSLMFTPRRRFNPIQLIKVSRNA